MSVVTLLILDRFPDFVERRVMPHHKVWRQHVMRPLSGLRKSAELAATRLRDLSADDLTLGLLLLGSLCHHRIERHRDQRAMICPMDTTKERKGRERLSREKRLRDGEPIVHGRMGGYNNWGCRCGPCTAAYMDWYTVHAAQRKPAQRRLPQDLEEIAAAESDEIASLIQEQYNDDTAIRVGYATRLPRFDGLL